MLSEEAFMAFYQASAGDLRRYAARMTGSVTQADDVVQEAYLRLVRHPPSTEDPQELRAYVFRIASNLMKDQQRRQRRQWGKEGDAAEPPMAVDAESRLDIARTFRRLPLRDRQLMWLAYVEGESHRAIAAAIGVREPSVRVLLSRARARLKNLLKGDTDI
jgi:RNA polymerase sigma-70 factor (ECF subfamily)